MKRIAAALLPLLACAEAPQDAPPSEGTAYVHTPQGILEVDYTIVGDRVVIDDMTVPVDEFFAAVIDPADLDDAIAGGNARAATRALGRFRWSAGRIPYRLASDLTASQRTNVATAIAHWQANTPFRFVERTTETDFVTFHHDDGTGVLDNACHSDAGRSGGDQPIDVDNCGSTAIIHEIGHLVGFFHEQTRLDRDHYVTINWDHITPGQEGNFKKYIEVQGGRDGTDIGDYDYGSIMHYRANQFSADGQDTITPTQSGVTLSNTTGLSVNDIRAAYRLVNPGGNYIGGGLVTLLRDPNLEGAFQTYGLGAYTAAAGDFATVGDNATSSIYIAPGTWVRAWVGGVDDPIGSFGSTQLTLPPPFDNSISRIYVTRAVTAYRDEGQRGVSQTFPIGEWKATSGAMSVVGDNQITSLYIPPGLVAELCTTSTAETCFTYEGTIFTLGNTMNNQASMIRVKPAVTLFTSPSLAGTRKSLIAGSYAATAWAPVTDGNIRSLVVGDGLQATLCDHADGTGSCGVYRGDVSYTGSPGIFGSWIKIEPNTVP